MTTSKKTSKKSTAKATTSKKTKSKDLDNTPEVVVDAIKKIKEGDVEEIKKVDKEEVLVKNMEHLVERVNFIKNDKVHEHSTIAWDFSKDDYIPYFDIRLSYQLTGYKPINRYEALDFNPNWFTVAREVKRTTGEYCSYPKNTKAYADFWDEETRRCIQGYKVNGYKITGDHYFFLNYYILPRKQKGAKSGSGRPDDFPDFYVGQYEYFHYIELCRILGYDAVGLKARGVDSGPLYTKGKEKDNSEKSVKAKIIKNQCE